MALNHDDAPVVLNRMIEWAGMLIERNAFPLLLVYVGPDNEPRFLTTAPPGCIPVADALERAAASIRLTN